MKMVAKKSSSFFAAFFLLTGILFSTQTKAQDAVFSQFYAAGLYLNPALAGVEPDMMLGLNYRSQWRSIASPYVTMQASFIYPIYSGSDVSRNHLGGIGLSVYNDKAGDGNLQRTGGNINLAYNVSLSEMQHIGLGIQVGFIQKRIQPGSLRWGSQYDPFTGYDPDLTADPNQNINLSNNMIYPDVSAGIMYYYNPERNYDEGGFSGFIGFSGYHINQPNESLLENQVSTLPVLINGQLGVEFNLSPSVNISPNVLAVYQNEMYQVNSGVYLTYMFSEQSSVLGPTALTAGGWYRLEDSFIASVGLGNDYYMIGFSYDLNTSSLRNNTMGRGAYEISLRITKPDPESKTKTRFHTPRI